MPASASHRPRRRPTIIAALLIAATLAVAGCSALKLGYGQASPLAFRWIDGYVDFDDAQSLRVKGALDETLAWHRRTQLPETAVLLARMQGDVLADTTPEQVCSLADTLRRHVEVTLEHVAPTVAEVALTLTPKQIGNIEKRYRERNETYRDDFLQRDPDKRLDAAAAREIDRAEMLYGRLDDRERALLRRSVALSPFDGELAYSERLNRQQDAVALIRRLIAARAGRDEALAQMRVFVQRLDRSPRANYQVYAERLVDYNCATIAALHNLTTDAQRRTAVAKLKAYEADLRELAASPG